MSMRDIVMLNITMNELVTCIQTALILHYSVLEFPTMVVEFEKDDFHVIDG